MNIKYLKYIIFSTGIIIILGILVSGTKIACSPHLDLKDGTVGIKIGGEF
ncbi:MAG TPA: hypothetical protein VMZ91_05060 [Candidatus Paceibacterota bacterium]|nr:hypothetical protein [Candidatus Paceibacterota bacterium]